jgi:hypothetical protein
VRRGGAVAAVIAVLAAAACSGGGGGPASSTPTSVPCSPAAPPPSGAPNPNVTPVDGSDSRNVGLPPDLTLPLIVHARRAGSGSFVVRGIDALGSDTQVLASALGTYDGTFAVGFVDNCATPTVGLHVESTGKWHLDVAEARLAHRYTTGVAGKGDSVFSYIGKAAKARVTYSGHTRFNVTTYGADGPKLLVRSTNAYAGTVTLPREPIFVAVTADGVWKIEPL